MKANKGTGTVKEYQGKTLATPVDYSFDYETFETVSELREAGRFPSDGDILDLINKKVEVSAKQAAYVKATADLKAKYEASNEYKRAQFIKAAIAGGMSESDANQIADSMPNLKVS